MLKNTRETKMLNYQELLERHNTLVKPSYKVEDLNVFIDYINQNYDGYIEIPSNQCKSGHAEILE
jgi:hypothetical protein